MAHIVVHRIEDIARRRLGRAAQIEALPPQPKRHQGNHWQLNRRNFVHPYIPNTPCARLGGDALRLCQAKEAARRAGVPLDQVELITLDDLLILPDLISGAIEGIEWSTPTWPTPPAPNPIPPGEYLDTDRTGTTVATIAFSGAAGQRTVRGPAIPAPVRINSIAINHDGAAGDFIRAAVHGYGEIINYPDTGAPGVGWPYVVNPMALVTFGSIQPELTNGNLAGTFGPASLIVHYTQLRRR